MSTSVFLKRKKRPISPPKKDLTPADSSQDIPGGGSDHRWASKLGLFERSKRPSRRPFWGGTRESMFSATPNGGFVCFRKVSFQWCFFFRVEMTFVGSTVTSRHRLQHIQTYSDWREVIFMIVHLRSRWSLSICNETWSLPVWRRQPPVFCWVPRASNPNVSNLGKLSFKTYKAQPGRFAFKVRAS